MNPANDPAALQSRILEDVRGSLRDQADQMVEAARQRLSEERRRDLEVSKSIKALRSSQAVSDSDGHPADPLVVFPLGVDKGDGIHVARRWFLSHARAPRPQDALLRLPSEECLTPGAPPLALMARSRRGLPVQG